MGANNGIASVRNLALCGHGYSGKTTLADHLLVLTGAVSGNPSVDAGTSVCDFEPEEKKHKHSIDSSLVHFEHAGHRFNVIDTPGYPDFIGQALGALYAVETAVIVLNAVRGIEVNSRRLFHAAGKAGVGRVIVLNRFDEPNVDFVALVEQIREEWGAACIPFQIPIGQGPDFRAVAAVVGVGASPSGAVIPVDHWREVLTESIIEADEALLEKYLEGEVPPVEKLFSLAPAAIAQGKVIPILCCSAKTNVGLPELLQVLEQCGLAPDKISRHAMKDQTDTEVPAAPDSRLAALVFKTRIDPFVQKLSYIRLFSGQLKKDDVVQIPSSRKGIKVGAVFAVQGGETKPVEVARAGDIVALAKLDELHTCDSLGELKFPSIPFPTPMVGLAVSPKNHGDETKLSNSLHKIVEEDATFRVDHDPQTKELVLNGLSELHLHILIEKLHRRDKLDVDTHDPKIPFRETIQANAEGSYRHKKQSGGRGQFGEVHIRMFPLIRGVAPADFATKARFPQMKDYHYDEANNFLWINSIVGGSIPGNFLPAIEKGFKERMARGVIAGHQVQDVAVEVHYGKHHEVDSSEAAFKTAGSMAFRDVFLQAKPALLEPVVRLEVVTPESHVGDIYGDLSTRGGKVLGTDSAGGKQQVVRAEVALRALSHYARSLSSLTGGQGSFTMEFDHYAPMPAHIQQEVISKAKLKEEEE